MRKIIIVVGNLFSTEERGDDRVSIRDLFSLYPEVLSSPSESRCMAILRYAKDFSGDCLVDNAIDNLSNYTCIKEGLLALGENLDRVIVKYPATSVDKDYEQFYDQHARWMDYSPEAAKQIAEEYVKSLRSLVEQIRLNGTEVEEISAPI